MLFRLWFLYLCKLALLSLLLTAASVLLSGQVGSALQTNGLEKRLHWELRERQYVVIRWSRNILPARCTRSEVIL